MKENDLLKEEELDNVLNSLFLNGNAVEADISAAHFILAQEYEVKIDSKKEKELLARLNGKSKGGFGFRIFLSLFVIIIIVAVIIWNQVKDNKADHLVTTGMITKENVANTLHDPIPFVQPIDNPYNSNTNKMPGLNPDDHSIDKYDLSIYANSDKPTNSNPILQGNSTSLFPKFQIDTVSFFSEEELLFYKGVKSEMLARLFTIDESLYSKIDEGHVQYKKTDLPVDAFVIRNFSITNLEYKTFLADLVADGRTADFSTAMVHPEIWNAYNCPQLDSAYFSDPRYNNFPVVNISREGADLFCKWFQQEINEYALLKNPGAKQLKIRLPYDYEWIFAATEGYAELPDCGGYNTIFDPHEELVDKMFIKRIAYIKKIDKSIATNMDQLFATNRFGMKEEEILGIFNQGMSASPTAYPNGIAQASKPGHVSEIIQNSNRSTVIMGSCWKTKQEYSEMTANFYKQLGSPFVGFRIVIANASKGSYKNPFW